MSLRDAKRPVGQRTDGQALNVGLPNMINESGQSVPTPKRLVGSRPHFVQYCPPHL